jgi:ABC-2 type transport system permease protein
MRSIWALAIKDLRLMARDRMGLFFTLAFPVIYAVLFGSVMSGATGGGGGSGRVTIAATDLDGTEASKELLAALESAKGLALTRTENADEATALVRTRKAAGALVIPKGYGEAAARPFWGEPATLELALDPSRQAEGGMVQGIVTEQAFRRFQTLFTQPGAMRKTAADAMASLDQAPEEDRAKLAPLRGFLAALDGLFASGVMAADPANPGAAPRFEPVRIALSEVEAKKRAGPRSSFEISFPQAVAWAMMSASFGFALSLVSERMRGTLTRLELAPMPRRHILLGKALACLVVNLVVVSVVLAVGVLFLGVRPSSLLLLGAAIVSGSIGFVGVMLLISVCGKTQASVSGIGWGIMLVLAMMGGAMVPAVFMPDWMRTAGAISPIRWAIEAMEGAFWRGYSPAQMLTPCLVLIGIGVGGSILGIRVFRFDGGKG